MKKTLLFLFYLVLLPPFVLAQENKIKNNSFFYPHILRNYTLIHTIGLSSANLPEDVVETDDEFRAPEFLFGTKLGIPGNFLLESSFKTNWITFHLALGPKWTYEFGRFTSSIGCDAAFFTGSLNQYDFKSSINGWNAYPNLTLGYIFPNFSISLKSEVLLVLDQTAKTGDIEVTSSFETFSGYSFTIIMEQPLWKDNFFVMAFKSNYVRFFYPMWITFSTFDRFFFIPEVIFSFNL